PTALRTSCMGLMPVRATFSLSIITRWPSGVSPMKRRPPRLWRVAVSVLAMGPAYRRPPGLRLGRENLMVGEERPAPPAGGDKAAWRAWAKVARAAARARLGPEVDAAVARHLLAWDRLEGARALGVYLAFGDEVDL